MSRPLSVFALAMINVAAVSSIRNWPTIAEYGLSSLFFLGLAIVLFFIPVSMVSAELATGWPEEGGVYAWVKAAFGHRTGFLAIWLLWAENLVYYPALISFIAGAIAYLINPELIHNTSYVLLFILGLFWATTLANLQGIKISSWISSIGVLLGTVIPGVFIIGLGAVWFFSGQPIQLTFSWDHLIPNLSSPRELVFFSGVLVSLCGMEMSAVHAGRVQHPQRNYPKAILLSGIIILALYLFGVLAIALVIPQQQISLVAGTLQAFSIFASTYHLDWTTPIMAVLLAFGAFGTLSTWVAGPSVGLLAAAKHGDLPPLFRKLNIHEMPVALLIGQAMVVSLFSVAFVIMPTVSSAYWILNATLAQIYLVMYVLMFLAAIKLRYKYPHVKRAFTIPGKTVGMWVVAGLGLIGSLCTFAVGFFPPAQIKTGDTLTYVTYLVISIIVVCLSPSIILLFRTQRWSKGK
jgi:putative glutamate/gamma-aminobutyrate antiporter